MLQKQTHTVKTPTEKRKEKKKEYKFNEKHTSFELTQPRYMNGIIAPALLAGFIAYFINILISIAVISLKTQYSLIGIELASFLYMISYIFILRPSLLNGGLPLKYHTNKNRAVPLGFLVWTAISLGILNLPRTITILGFVYKYKFAVIGVSFVVFISFLYVLTYWTLMVGPVPMLGYKKVERKIIPHFHYAPDPIEPASPYSFYQPSQKKTSAPKRDFTASQTQNDSFKPKPEDIPTVSKTKPIQSPSTISHKKEESPKHQASQQRGIVKKAPR